MSSESYSEKVKDPRWQKKRLHILARDEWMCPMCGNKEFTLVVRHRRYLSDKEPWDYPNELLITLWEACHGYARESMPGAERFLIDTLKAKFHSDDVCKIAMGFRYMKIFDPKVVAEAYQWAPIDPDMQKEKVARYFVFCQGAPIKE